MKHILDMLNLIFIHIPGFALLLIICLKYVPWKKINGRDLRFLFVLIVSALGAAFLIDPKLGMPRDWDLFSFLGVSLAIAGYYMILRYIQDKRIAYSAALLSIVLGFIVLIPRAISQTEPEIALKHFKSYILLDKAKNRYVSLILKNFHLAQGDTVRAEGVEEIWKQRYPEKELLLQADRHLSQGRIEAAIAVDIEILKIAPTLWTAYLNLGRCMIVHNRIDSALSLLKIANVMSPYNPYILTDIGRCENLLGQLDEAEASWLKAYKNGPYLFQPPQNLLKLYKKQGDHEKYRTLLLKAGQSEYATLEILRELGQWHLKKKEYHRAAGVLQRATKKGLSQEDVLELLEQYPQLGKYLTQ